MDRLQSMEICEGSSSTVQLFIHHFDFSTFNRCYNRLVLWTTIQEISEAFDRHMKLEKTRTCKKKADQKRGI